MKSVSFVRHGCYCANLIGEDMISKWLNCDATLREFFTVIDFLSVLLYAAMIIAVPSKQSVSKTEVGTTNVFIPRKP